ncbi:flagellar protein [Bradyrhizobium genosp. L]|uniref:flagellar protein n=1 Tax=Bradyrhizobium genosp. L TaxID=83637 RepID=UPI0018A29A93|nr:flagellar protein [Bradyrhizobium genosp. L]QPF82851.1 flagellar protein [Bradyrhizobium genosp. L]
MTISGVSGRTSYIGTTITNLRDQLNDLTTQLATGKVSTTYAGQGLDRGFGLSLRAQISSINAFADTATNLNTRLGVANLALQGLSDINAQVKKAATTATLTLNQNGQTSGQITAQAAFSNAVSMLNSQSGDRYLFSGRAMDTPATVSANTMLHGTATQAGLTQLIDERKQADQGTAKMGRLTVSSPPATTTVTDVAEDGSPFGLKLLSVQSSLTGGASVTQPNGTPKTASVDLGAVNPKDGDKIKFNFALPDGSTEAIELTATTTNPPPAGSFLIGADTAATTANLQSTLTSSIKTLSDTSLVAASAVAASNNFFNPVATVSGAAVNNQNTPPAPITGATALSGAVGTDSLSTSFAAGDTITVNGTPITFVASGATGNQLNVTDSVQTLLSKIDEISGTNPSTVSNGAITLHGADGADLSISSSNTAALGALGIANNTTATAAPLRVGGPPFDTAANLVAGTPANTVTWYTGENGAGSARGTAVAQVDQSISVQYGARANEQAFRYMLQNVAVYAAVTIDASNPNASAQVTALAQRVAANLAPQNGQQQIQDVQAEFAGAQTATKAATDRQTQLKGMAETMLDQVEGINQDEVATKILALQTSLQASYQTTSMLYQTTLLKYLPIG